MPARSRRSRTYGWHRPRARATRRPRGPGGPRARPAHPDPSLVLLRPARRTSLLLGAFVVVDLPEDLLDPLAGHDAGVDLEGEARHLPNSQLPAEHAAEMRP